MRKHWLFLLLLAGASLSFTAVAAPDLYTTTVSAESKSSAARADALRRALGEVMVRIAGDPRAPQMAGADRVLSQARSLVQQYGYQGSDASGLELRAVFAGSEVQRAMRDAGLPVWGQSRPPTLAWLVADGELVTRDGPEAIVKAMSDAAERRGLSLRFPRGSAATSGRVTPADIRDGNVARVASVSRGYGASNLLIGEVEQAAGGWSADWRLVEKGDVISSWSDSAAQQGALAANAVGRSADVYARRYAVTDTGDSSSVAVAVNGIGGARGYTRVSSFLSGLIAVDTVMPAIVDGETVVFEVTGSGGAEVLERRIGLADWLASDKLARNLAGLHAGEGPSLGYSIDR